MQMPREEAQILEDLAALTASPGYVHALANIIHRDNFILIKGKLNPSDTDRLYSRERLIRTELTTLIGLMMKKPLDLSQQPIDVIDDYIKGTDALMRELHDSMSYPMSAAILEAIEAGYEPPDPWRGQGMREPIFYGTESAYAFQYRDLAPEKYGADDDWMLKAKGFTIAQAKTIAQTMCALMDEKGIRLFEDARAAKPPLETWLSAFEFSLDEVAHRSSLAQDVVESFLRAFIFKGDNAAFREVGDFNEVAARPLLPTDRGTVLLFSHYAIYEALCHGSAIWRQNGVGIMAPVPGRHKGANSGSA